MKTLGAVEVNNESAVTGEMEKRAIEKDKETKVEKEGLGTAKQVLEEVEKTVAATDMTSAVTTAATPTVATTTTAAAAAATTANIASTSAATIGASATYPVVPEHRSHPYHIKHGIKKRKKCCEHGYSHGLSHLIHKKLHLKMEYTKLKMYATRLQILKLEQELGMTEETPP